MATYLAFFSLVLYSDFFGRSVTILTLHLNNLNIRDIEGTVLMICIYSGVSILNSEFWIFSRDLPPLYEFS